MASITGSVGKGGVNKAVDVSTVQELLRGRGFSPGAAGQADAATIAAIEAFQARFMTRPDGCIDVNGNTWRQLVGQASNAPATAWSGDPSKWPQEQKLRSMKPEMAAKVQAVLDKLTARGFQPVVFYGWRSVAVQAQLFAEGKSTVRFSFHNAQQRDGTPNSYAADIIDKRFAWSDQAKSSGFWAALGEEAKAQGLVWGGDWKNFPDVAHVQLVGNDQLQAVMRESGL